MMSGVGGGGGAEATVGEAGKHGGDEALPLGLEASKARRSRSAVRSRPGKGKTTSTASKSAKNRVRSLPPPLANGSKPGSSATTNTAGPAFFAFSPVDSASAASSSSLSSSSSSTARGSAGASSGQKTATAAGHTASAPPPSLVAVRSSARRNRGTWQQITNSGGDFVKPSSSSAAAAASSSSSSPDSADFHHHQHPESATAATTAPGGVANELAALSLDNSSDRATSTTTATTTSAAAGGGGAQQQARPSSSSSSSTSSSSSSSGAGHKRELSSSSASSRPPRYSRLSQRWSEDMMVMDGDDDHDQGDDGEGADDERGGGGDVDDADGLLLPGVMGDGEGGMYDDEEEQHQAGEFFAANKRTNNRQRTPSAIRELKEAAVAASLQQQQQQPSCSSSSGRLGLVKRRGATGFRRPASAPPLVIFPEACLEHDTWVGHQESSDRLRVLCGPSGVLRRPQFSGLQWLESGIREAALADILRVHEWSYVLHLRDRVQALQAQAEAARGRAGGDDEQEEEQQQQGGRRNTTEGAPGTRSHTNSSSSGAASASSFMMMDVDDPTTQLCPAPSSYDGGCGLPPPPQPAPQAAPSQYCGGSPLLPHHHVPTRPFPDPDTTTNSSSSSTRDHQSSLLLGNNGIGCHTGTFDHDTRISTESFRAGKMAAGAVIEAVDRAAKGDHSYIFVAARPPGHHAGPRGPVPSKHFFANPTMCSNGFCLLNSVAIGAAYARYNYGRASDGGPFQRVAIVDFDVHHGNGTEEIVKCVRPQRRAYPLPPSFPQMYYETFKPWLDETDADNIFFSSINLVDATNGFYPCSGFTGDDDPVAFPHVVNIELTPLPNTKPGHCNAPGKPPLKVNDSQKRKYTERASSEFRAKVLSQLLPRLQAFGADILFLSAGFDGHGEDLYHWLGDDDFYWLTRELMRVMSETEGCIISVLEGGYHLPPKKQHQQHALLRPGLRKTLAKGDGGEGATSSEDEASSSSSSGPNPLLAPSQSRSQQHSANGGSCATIGGPQQQQDGGLCRGVMAHVMAFLQGDTTTNGTSSSSSSSMMATGGGAR